MDEIRLDRTVCRSIYCSQAQLIGGAALAGLVSLGLLSICLGTSRRQTLSAGVIGGMLGGGGALLYLWSHAHSTRSKDPIEKGDFQGDREEEVDTESNSSIIYDDSESINTVVIGKKSSAIFPRYTADDIRDATNPPAIKIDQFGNLTDLSWPKKWHHQTPLEATYGFYIPSYERHRGANEGHLISIDGKYIPASGLQLANESVGMIVSEAPRGLGKGASLYYQMAIIQGSRLLVSLSSVFNSDNSKLDLEGYDFLQVNEERMVVTPYSGTFKIKCTLEEEVASGFGEQGDAIFLRRTLCVTPLDENSQSYSIYQYIPRGVPISHNNIRCALDVCNMLEEQKQRLGILVDERHPIIMNCKTGVDRSASFAVITQLCNDLLQFDEISDVEWENLPNHMLRYLDFAHLR